MKNGNIFASTKSGSTLVPWIAASGDTFNLYDYSSGSKGKLLASVVASANTPVVASITQSTASTIVNIPFTVSWSSTGATSCTVSRERLKTNQYPSYIQQQWASGTSGSKSAKGNIAATYTFKNTCTDSAGKTSVAQITHTITAVPASCTGPDGTTILSGSSKTYYSTSSVPSGSTCTSVSQSRTCNDGTLSGSVSYTYPYCNVAAPLPIGGALSVYPSRVEARIPTRTTFNWSLKNVSKEDICSINVRATRTGSVGHSIHGGMLLSLPVKIGPPAGGKLTLSPTITTQTEYYLECNGKKVDTGVKPVIVNVVPSFSSF